jgi:hypothetical protein
MAISLCRPVLKDVCVFASHLTYDTCSAYVTCTAIALTAITLLDANQAAVIVMLNQL